MALSNTVRQGSNMSCCGMYPLAPSRCGIATHPTSTRPDVGSSRPATMRSSVLLPQPLGPTTVTNSPGLTSMLTPSRARTVTPSSAYSLTSPSTTRPGGSARGSPSVRSHDVGTDNGGLLASDTVVATSAVIALLSPS